MLNHQAYGFNGDYRHVSRRHFQRDALLMVSPIPDKKSKADKGHPKGQAESGIVTIEIVERPRTSRSMTEIEKVIGCKKGTSGKTNNINDAPYQPFHSFISSW